MVELHCEFIIIRGKIRTQCKYITYDIASHAITSTMNWSTTVLDSYLFKLDKFIPINILGSISLNFSPNYDHLPHFSKDFKPLACIIYKTQLNMPNKDTFPFFLVDPYGYFPICYSSSLIPCISPLNELYLNVLTPCLTGFCLLVGP